MSNTQDLVGALCERWHTRIPSLAIVRAVEDSFPELVELPPPTKLMPLAAKRGITRVETTDLKADGLIFETEAGTFTVRVNRRHSAARRRFTCAHEIGHTFFFELEPSRAERLHYEDAKLGGVSGSADVESLCNVAAAEILMPYGQITPLVRDFGVGATALSRVSATFRVSLQAAARRIVQVSHIRLAVVMWQQVGRQFRPAWSVGRTIPRDGDEVLAVSEQDPAYSVFMQEGQFARRLWISLGGPLDEYFVDGLALVGRDGRRVLSVFVLDKAPERALSRRIERVRSVEQLPLF